MVVVISIFLLTLVGSCLLMYMSASKSIWWISLGVLAALLSLHGRLSLMVSIELLYLVSLLLFFSWRRIRLLIFTRFVLRMAKKRLPSFSATEEMAIHAGGIGWEAQLYHGTIDLQKLKQLQTAALSVEEEAFLNGPATEFCRMINSWELVHHQFTLPDTLLSYLKEKQFFAFIIPKKYGGLEFSAYAHSQIIAKIAGINASVASVVSVPNSLGPAELLLRYGTQEQKDYYLPALASAKEIPCFALTSPHAGSDAGSMIDYGTICRCKIAGKEGLGIRLNWNKRYITLAPIATLLGLAFKLFDPDHLLGDQDELGITCALIPVKTKGISIGRRHNPLHAVFPNGPVSGRDVLISIDQIIGGAERAGQGWSMLMECLAAGRSISLPSVATGIAKKLALTSGAYARVRQQFNLPIGHFGGIEHVLARITGRAYIMEAMRQLSLGRVDDGERSLVASAICKYHATEMARQVINDAMDIHAGKGICMGPKNYFADFYTAMPISITVEGANILTRSMMIYGQGMMRCHPYLLPLIKTLQEEATSDRLLRFDHVLCSMLSFSAANAVACLWHGLTASKTIRVSDFAVSSRRSFLKPYIQRAQRFTAMLATLSDVLLMFYGGGLKREECMSGRMADLHSYLYMFTAVLHYDQHQDDVEGSSELLIWSCESLLYQMQQSAAEIVANLPCKWMRFFLSTFLFPLGKRLRPPSDHLDRQVAHLLQEDSAMAKQLSAGCYCEPSEHHEAGHLLAALPKLIAIEPLLKKMRMAEKEGEIEGLSIFDRIESALHHGVVTEDEAQKLRDAELLRGQLLAVDDFEFSEFVPSYRR